MNQDQVKELLLELDNHVPDFSVIFSGKKSGKVDGLYYPDRREIIIHNKNFTEDGQLIYTAIHEFAHHLHHARSPVPVSARAHTNAFWDILHKVLFRAEEKGLYSNIFKKDNRFTSLTRKIRGEYLQANGSLMKGLGALLEQAYALCLELNLSFDDYVDRELLLHRSAAKLLMKMHSMNLDPKIGYENMKTVAGIKDDSTRARAEEAFAEGMTSDMVKAEINYRKKPGDAINVLLEERDRIERSIDSLTKKLAKVERRLQELKFEDSGRGEKMTKTPRDIKEVEKIREEMLDKAVEIINADGFKGLTMRKLAVRMEMSATNLYNYFSNKDEIYINILIRGFKMLYENLKTVYDVNPDPLERGKKIIQSYLSFGIQNYNYYEIMFSTGLPKYADYVGTPLENLAAIEMGYSKKIIDLSMDAVSDVMRHDKNARAAGHEMRMIEVWSMLHGMISLYNSRMIDYITPKPVNKYESIIDDIINLITR